MEASCSTHSLSLLLSVAVTGCGTQTIDKFSRFRSIREIFLTVDDCNMDECLESLWLLVYYQVSGELGIAHCSNRLDIYLGECGLARKLIH